MPATTNRLASRLEKALGPYVDPDPVSVLDAVYSFLETHRDEFGAAGEVDAVTSSLLDAISAASDAGQEEGEFFLTLATVGNPDFGEDWQMPLPGVPLMRVKVTSYAQASKVCRSYISRHILGAGNWAGGRLDNSDGHEVARVSYNGRVWPPGQWRPGMTTFYEPE